MNWEAESGCLPLRNMPTIGGHLTRSRSPVRKIMRNRLDPDRDPLQESRKRPPNNGMPTVVSPEGNTDSRLKKKKTVKSDIYGNEYIYVDPMTVPAGPNPESEQCRKKSEFSYMKMKFKIKTFSAPTQNHDFSCEDVFKKYCQALELQNLVNINTKTVKRVNLTSYDIEVFHGSFYWEKINGEYLPDADQAREYAFAVGCVALIDKYGFELRFQLESKASIQTNQTNPWVPNLVNQENPWLLWNKTHGCTTGLQNCDSLQRSADVPKIPPPLPSRSIIPPPPPPPPPSAPKLPSSSSPLSTSNSSIPLPLAAVTSTTSMTPYHPPVLPFHGFAHSSIASAPPSVPVPITHNQFSPPEVPLDFSSKPSVAVPPPPEVPDKCRNEQPNFPNFIFTPFHLVAMKETDTQNAVDSVTLSVGRFQHSVAFPVNPLDPSANTRPSLPPNIKYNISSSPTELSDCKTRSVMLPESVMSSGVVSNIIKSPEGAVVTKKSDTTLKAISLNSCAGSTSVDLAPAMKELPSKIVPSEPPKMIWRHSRPNRLKLPAFKTGASEVGLEVEQEAKDFVPPGAESPLLTKNPAVNSPVVPVVVQQGQTVELRISPESAGEASKTPWTCSEKVGPAPKTFPSIDLLRRAYSSDNGDKINIEANAADPPLQSPAAKPNLIERTGLHQGALNKRSSDSAKVPQSPSRICQFDSASLVPKVSSNLESSSLNLKKPSPSPSLSYQLNPVGFISFGPPPKTFPSMDLLRRAYSSDNGDKINIEANAADPPLQSPAAKPNLIERTGLHQGALNKRSSDSAKVPQSPSRICQHDSASLVPKVSSNLESSSLNLKKPSPSPSLSYQLNPVGFISFGPPPKTFPSMDLLRRAYSSDNGDKINIEANAADPPLQSPAAKPNLIERIWLHQGDLNKRSSDSARTPQSPTVICQHDGASVVPKVLSNLESSSLNLKKPSPSPSLSYQLNPVGFISFDS